VKDDLVVINSEMEAFRLKKKTNDYDPK